MKSTQETLQLAIEEHRRNLEKAEQYYRKILQTDQNNQHANHNLGLLIKLISNPQDALPFVGKALEINPKEEQFWISYIETLIEANQLDKALKVLSEAKNKLNSQKIAIYETHIRKCSENKNLNNVFSEINKLIALYNNKLFEEAENKAKQINRE